MCIAPVSSHWGRILTFAWHRGQFVAHGFAGAIKAWLSDNSVTKTDLIEAAVACAPIWWT
jgi:hypothetical protein